MRLFGENSVLNDWWKRGKSKDDLEALVLDESTKIEKMKDDARENNLTTNEEHLKKGKFHTYHGTGKHARTPLEGIFTADSIENQPDDVFSSKMPDEVFSTETETPEHLKADNSFFTHHRVHSDNIINVTEHQHHSDNIISVAENVRSKSEGNILSSYLTKTEIVLPAEFLFCNKVDDNNNINNFASLFPSLSKSEMRRSKSCSTIGRSPSEEDETFSYKRLSNYEIRMPTNETFVSESPKHTLSPNDASECVPDGIPRTPQSESDFEDISLPTIHIRRSSGNKYTEVTNIDESVNENVNESVVDRINMLKVPHQTKNRRTESCKTSHKRQDSLFSINQYIKKKYKQRSKSFATVRQFSNDDSSHSWDHDGGRATQRSHSRTFHDTLDIEPVETTMNFDVNHTDEHGNSCLHHAASKGDITTIKYLLEQGGDVWLKNDQHLLPLDVANNFQTAKLLSGATLFYGNQSDKRNEFNIAKTSKLNIAL